MHILIYLCNLFSLLYQLKSHKSKDIPVKINIPRCLNIWTFVSEYQFTLDITCCLVTGPWKGK